MGCVFACVRLQLWSKAVASATVVQCQQKRDSSVAPVAGAVQVHFAEASSSLRKPQDERLLYVRQTISWRRQHLFTRLTRHLGVNGVFRYINHQAVAPKVTGALRTGATQAGPPRCTHLLTPDFVYKRQRSTLNYAVQKSLMQLCKSRLCHIST